MLINSRLMGNNPLNYPLWTDTEIRSAWTSLILIMTEEDLVDLPVLIVTKLAAYILGLQAHLETQALVRPTLRPSNQLSHAQALAESLNSRIRRISNVAVERVNIL